MYTLENDRIVVIPVEALSLILEKQEDGSYIHKGCPAKISLEESLNQVRARVHESLLDYKHSVATIDRGWKRYQATKEFMDEGELRFHESRWAGFDINKYLTEKNETINGLSRSIFEITDFMLENNITVKALEEDQVEVRTVSLDEIKNMFDGFGKTE